jgi:anti-sigma regulatory factor (Ser/Thr protein kinase)
MCRDVVHSFAGDRRAPALAREFFAAQLAAALPGPGGARIVDDVTLIISELVTNAVNAGSPTVRVHLSVHRERLRVSVHDEASGEPQPRHAVPTDVGGRGLVLLGVLAHAWGVEAAPPGKQVWAEVSYPAELTPALKCHSPA